MKLWEGRFAQPSAKSADAFNQSLSFDKKLYWHDIFASIAHVKMLGETKILPAGDAEKICDALQQILADIESGKLPSRARRTSIPSSRKNSCGASA